MLVFIYCVYFCFYITFEVIWNALAKVFGWYDVFKPYLVLNEDGVVVESIPKSKWRLEGFASIWVGIVGGLVGIGMFGFYSIPIFQSAFMLPIYCLISGIMITSTELGLGIILDKFNVRPWDYDNEPFNYKGHISLPRSIGWTLLGIIIWFINAGIYELLIGRYIKLIDYVLDKIQ